MINLNLRDTDEIQRDQFRFLGRPLVLLGGIEYEIIDSQYTNTPAGFVDITETIRIKINSNIPEETYQAIIDTVTNPGETYLLHNTRIVIPDENIANSSVGNNARYQSDAFSHYNIKNVQYEALSEINNERVFPNFLLGALWNKAGGQFTGTKIEEYYSMFNQIPQLVNSDILSEPPRINGYEFDNEEIAFDSNGSIDYNLEQAKDYYKVLLNNFETPRNQYASANTHVFVDFNYNQTDSTKTGNTPFFNRIKLPYENMQLTTVFPNNTVSEVQTPINTLSPINMIFSSCQLSDLLYKSFRNSNSFTRNFTINGTETDIKVYDLLDLINNFDLNNLIDQVDEMVLRDPEEPLVSKQNNPFLFFFYKLKLIGKMRARNKAVLKNFEKLIINDEKHSKENIGFKVIKRLAGRSQPIQTFYFTNRVGMEDFVDTQVKFDRVYTYEIIALYAIYGSQYSYTAISPENDQREITFLFRCSPSIKIAEVPVKTHTMRIIEPPPIIPEINFFNEKRSKNKLKIFFEHQDGNYVDEYNVKPMRSFAGNQEYISRLNEYFNSTDVLMSMGKTSDGIYEIYRLEEPPKTIQDFEDSLIAVVQSGVVYSNGQRSKNCAFVDYIKHQTKYYYAFRVLTHRGNTSELSQIYEVEMYEDADETFLTYGIYQMPEIETFSRDYKMRKYLQIVPNFEHVVSNEADLLEGFTNAQDALFSLSLGQEDLQEKLFDHNNKNKFIKLRLESKNSGKKLDLNLMFDIKKQT